MAGLVFPVGRERLVPFDADDHEKHEAVKRAQMGQGITHGDHGELSSGAGRRFALIVRTYHELVRR